MSGWHPSGNPSPTGGYPEPGRSGAAGYAYSWVSYAARLSIVPCVTAMFLSRPDPDPRVTLDILRQGKNVTLTNYGNLISTR
jgi:hypothetical protein